MWRNQADSFFFLKKDNTLALFTTRREKGLIERIGAKKKVYLLKQIHSNRIIDIDKEDADVGDGLVTGHQNIFIGVKVADCLPIYFLGKDRVGIAHAGWRGTLNKIVHNMLEKFEEEPCYALASCIGPCCYEVGGELRERFKKDFPEEVFIVKDGKFFLDLKAANRFLLKGLKEMASLDLCTKCYPSLFYSYRGEGGIIGSNYALLGMVDMNNIL